ncbi:hypothetical protein V9T40_012623 [Parthenolecanium corni]|uniref:COMM domain-containing protein 3 n=1 Tax=Parthenolecanium corni TaxID=536013 RepID=A0AAN9T7L5_9HEMI
MEIRLSDETLTGLRRLCNRSLVNEDYFYRLLKEFLKTGQSSAEKPEKDKSEIDEYKSDVLKTAYASLAVLLIEAARHDLDNFKLKTVLEGYNLDTSRISLIVDAYQSGKSNIQTSLSKIGTNLPHIIDVRWRMDLRIESDYLGERAFQPYFIIELVTVTSSNNKKIVKFSCTPEGLQELVCSLKAAARHVTKIITPSK